MKYTPILLLFALISSIYAQTEEKNINTEKKLQDKTKPYKIALVLVGGTCGSIITAQYFIIQYLLQKVTSMTSNMTKIREELDLLIQSCKNNTASDSSISPTNQNGQNQSQQRSAEEQDKLNQELFACRPERCEDYYEINNMKKALDRGAQINAKDKNGDTVLIMAVRRFHQEMVAFLLARGADMNIKDKHGLTALQIAEENKKMHAERYGPIVHLLEKAALKQPATIYPSKLSSEQQTAINQKFFYWCNPRANEQQDKQPTIRADLLAQGAQINCRGDDYGTTPLMCAAMARKADAVQFLLKNGADPKLTNTDGKTALNLVKGYEHLQPEQVAPIITLLEEAERTLS